jgi:ABC-type glycerol-3-phosphate transport system substrate-binding protein
MALRMTRRDMLRHASVGSAALLLAACQPKIVEVEKVVKETVEVEKVVKETVEVEKEVQKVVKETVIIEAKPAEKEPVTLRIHTNQGDQWYGWMKDAWDLNVGGWKSENPHITLQFEPVAGWTADYFPKIFTHVAAGTLGDVVWYPPRHRNHVSWGIEYNIVRDLMPLVEASNYDLGQFYPGVIESSSWEGKFYWMPITSEPSCPVIAYNKTMAERFGLPEPQNDWAMDELVEWGKAGTRDDVWGYHWGHSSMAPIAWTPQLRQFGVTMASDDGKQAFPDSKDALVEALKWRYDLIYTHKTMPAPDPSFNTGDMFVAEVILAMDIWPVFINRLPATLVQDKFDVGFFYTPLDVKGAKRRNMLNEHVHGVTVASKYPEESFNYLAWHSSLEYCVQGLLSGKGAPVGRPDLFVDERALKIFPGLALLEPVMAEIEPDFFVGNFRGEEFDSAFVAVTDLVALDKIGIDEAVDRIIADCQAVLDKEPA